jgi:hypothetical protein
VTDGARGQAAVAGAARIAPASPRSEDGRKQVASAVAARIARAGIYDPRIHCGAKMAGTRPGVKLQPGEQIRPRGAPCKQRKGFRTNHPGTGRCWLHTGKTLSGRAAGAAEAIANELRALAMPDQVKPIQSLYEAVRVASWREAGLRTMLQARQALAGPDHLGDHRPDVIFQMHDVALKRKAEIAKMAVDAGLDQRMVEIAEREADLLHRALLAGLEAGGVTSPKAREAAFEAVRLVIDRVAPREPAGVELS